MSDARLTSVLVLQKVLDDKIFLSEAKTTLDSHSEADSAFANMLLLTTLRHLIYLKNILKQYVKKKLPRQSRIAEYALLLATAEILYLNTPDYAVINSYVNIVKTKLDKYIAGFANAVLRRVCADKERLVAEDEGLFFPLEFRRLLKNSYSDTIITAIEKASICEPQLDLSAREDALSVASMVDGTCLPGGTIRLANNGNITKIPGYSEGLWWVQDFSSALPVKMLGSVTNLKVLDLCAAPGGKTAQLIAGGAKVTAVDISAKRLEKLQENLRRNHLKAEKIICADALKYLRTDTISHFDVILLDAPCSATGTLRRHPELVHIKNNQDVARMAALQKELLNTAADKLCPGGRLLYCTCSLNKTEGEKQISAFLQDQPTFRTHPAATALPEELAELCTPEGFLRILPSHLSGYGGADGFFAAVLTKDGAHEN